MLLSVSFQFNRFLILFGDELQEVLLWKLKLEIIDWNSWIVFLRLNILKSV